MPACKRTMTGPVADGKYSGCPGSFSWWIATGLSKKQ